MKNLIILYVFASVVLFASALYSQDKNYSVNETDITSPNGDAFTITLDANKSTGYSWSAEVSDTTILMIEGSDYVVPETHVMGRAGQEVWRFRGVMQGSVTIVFKYARPWDKDTPAAKSVTFNVKVQ
jgi:predicted secreted protein